MPRCCGRLGFLVLLASLGPVSQARAVITYLLPLKTMLGNAEHVCLARIESFDPDRPSMVLSIEEDLKGKLPGRKLPVLLKGDAEAARLKHVPALLKRLDKGLPLMLFVSEEEGKFFGFCYTNGTWFQVLGTRDGKDIRWALTHGEPTLRRTFKGPTADLKQIVADALARKKEAPAPDEKEKPGFGPEVEKKDARQCRAAGGPLFAVIPTVAIGGPLAILAMLFPAVFGGVLVLFRRWVVLISVVGLNSTLYMLHGWFAEDLAGRWWATPRVLWLVMTMLTILGVGFTWRRQVRALAQADASPERPTRLEQWLLYSFSAASLVFFVLLFSGLLTTLTNLVVPLGEYDNPVRPSASDRLNLLLQFPLPLVLCLGLWAGALATAWHVLALRRGQGNTPRLPTEGVVLGVMALASVLLIPEGASSRPVAMAALKPGEPGATQAKLSWEFELPATGKTSYEVSASPLVDGDRVYIGIIHASPFAGRRGVLYGIDRSSNRVAWTYDADGTMANMFSSPVLADGKLYVGEGYHENQKCRLFCLDAVSGKPAWPEPFETNSHVESTPAVAEGKVVFGAGDDGVFCVEAATGKRLWQYPSTEASQAGKGVHVDASPVIVGSRVYCCSGVSQKFQRLQVFCLDLATGKPIWTQEEGITLPCWGSPTVVGDHVYVGLGNGRLTISEADVAKRRGAVLCLRAANGERVWEYGPLTDAVHCKPTVDEHHVYFVSRDGRAYAVERRTGRLVWDRAADLGSPSVAAPALAACTHCGASTSLYAAGIEGDIFCLNPNSGASYWHHSERTPTGVPELISSPCVVVSRTPEGDRRQVFFATSIRQPFTGASSVRLFCLEDLWNDGSKP